MRYILTIEALGYETTKTEVECDSIRSADRFIGKARKQWAEHNDVDYATTKLTSVTVQAK